MHISMLAQVSNVHNCTNEARDMWWGTVCKILFFKKEQTVIQFGPVKQHLQGHKFDNSEAVAVAVCKWLHMQQTDCYS